MHQVFNALLKRWLWNVKLGHVPQFKRLLSLSCTVCSVFVEILADSLCSYAADVRLDWTIHYEIKNL